MTNPPHTYMYMYIPELKTDFTVTKTGCILTRTRWPEIQWRETWSPTATRRNWYILCTNLSDVLEASNYRPLGRASNSLHGENLVHPTTTNEGVVSVWRLVVERHSRYCTHGAVLILPWTVVGMNIHTVFSPVNSIISFTFVTVWLMCIRNLRISPWEPSKFSQYIWLGRYISSGEILCKVGNLAPI